MTGISTNRAKKSAAGLGRPTPADLQFGSVTTMTEHVDVLIVGAGLSGIGAAHHLQAAFPGRTYTILEARDALGGTWDLFRYPGVRSDSDMHTLGYRFRPWTKDKAITDGPSILDYVRDTATEAGIDQHIRYGHRVNRAAWSTEDARWTVDAVNGAEPVRLTANFLFVCSGYYHYDVGHTPSFPGLERFAGTVIHPQQWPEDLDYAGKKIVVIGSGATAVTLVPALADRAERVTMLQRSPTYIAARPARDQLGAKLTRRLGTRGGYAVTRWKNVALSTYFFQLCRRRPEAVKALLRKAAIDQLPPGYDVDTHFAPRYNPWDQRMCLAPDGDFFAAIKSGRADVVTDQIAEFTEGGIRLASGAELEADIVVTATGLRLLALGGMRLAVDGGDVTLADTMVYKGAMLSGVPNLTFTFGYTNSSWTLKADLVSAYAVRLLRYLDAHGYDSCVPVNDDPAVSAGPMLDFQSGYIQRAIGEFPRSGSRGPWRVRMNYPRDVLTLRYGRINDGALRFSRRPPRAVSGAAAPAVRERARG
jgi:cation diffusion facilitator CzcD-associated flavoprotein CzcO